jgi:hypothetical protein
MPEVPFGLFDFVVSFLTFPAQRGCADAGLTAFFRGQVPPQSVGFFEIACQSLLQIFVVNPEVCRALLLFIKFVNGGSEFFELIFILSFCFRSCFYSGFRKYGLKHGQE